MDGYDTGTARPCRCLNRHATSADDIGVTNPPTKVIGAAVCLVLLVAALAVVLQRHDGNPCAVLSDRDQFESVSDIDSSGARPLTQAVRVALADAGLDSDVAENDIDPIVHSEGNVVDVGVNGYWIALAEVSRGYVAVDVPRPCSSL